MKDKKLFIEMPEYAFTPLLKEFLEKNKALIESADMVVHDEIIIQKSSACGPTESSANYDLSMFFAGATDKPLTRNRSNDDFTSSDNHEK